MLNTDRKIYNDEYTTPLKKHTWKVKFYPSPNGWYHFKATSRTTTLMITSGCDLKCNIVMHWLQFAYANKIKDYELINNPNKTI